MFPSLLFNTILPFVHVTMFWLIYLLQLAQGSCKDTVLDAEQVNRDSVNEVVGIRAGHNLYFEVCDISLNSIMQRKSTAAAV